MMETAESRPWSDLQLELLGLVLRRLPSLADRVRLRAVCHPWRSNSLFQSLPLPFPWLALPDGTFLSIPSSEIHRLSVPEGACCQGSIDNWLFLMHNDDCSLMNPFSKTSLELPKLAKAWKRAMYDPDFGFNPIFYKLVVPSPLDSSPCSLVAAMIMDDGNYGTLCISQPPIAIDSFRDEKHPVWHLGDVAFFDGKLYVLGGFGQLFIFELDKDIGISAMECIIDSLGDLGGTPQSLSSEVVYMVRMYLVECAGRLLMVSRWLRSVARLTSDDFSERKKRTVLLEVFEADLRTNPARWRRATELGGHALFLGQHSSKSLPASECSGYNEDCIYFMCDYPWPKWSANPLCDSGVYSIRDGTITPLVAESAAVPPRHVGQWRPTWFFPPELV
ncbi:hypothetical protein ACQ4PT_013391 [Festuca glaucescens]